MIDGADREGRGVRRHRASLLDTVPDNGATDIRSGRMPEIAATSDGADLRDIERIVLTPGDGHVTMQPGSGGIHWHPQLDVFASSQPASLARARQRRYVS